MPRGSICHFAAGRYNTSRRSSLTLVTRTMPSDRADQAAPWSRSSTTGSRRAWTHGRVILKRRRARMRPCCRSRDWIRVRAPCGARLRRKHASIVREHGLHTVCEEARCPNIGECWQKRHATMMIMGGICTRACAFCNVATGLPRAARCGRAATRRRCRGRARPRPRRHHVGRPRRSRRRRSGSLRGRDRGASAPRRRQRRIEVLIPDFLRKDGRARDRHRGARRTC